MTINHHASDELLIRYAAGRLSPAPALVVACHLEYSEDSRSRLDALESLGGALLEEQELAPVAADLFERTLSRLVGQEHAAAVMTPVGRAPSRLGIEVPRPLSRRTIGRWRWMGPGMQYARVEMLEDPEVNLVLLKIGAGRTMPRHGHSGSEVTLVLKGSFRDEHGRFGPGDFAEEDGESEHQPMVEDGGECICLAAIHGPMRPHGWIARLVQPFIGL